MENNKILAKFASDGKFVQIKTYSPSFKNWNSFYIYKKKFLNWDGNTIIDCDGNCFAKLRMNRDNIEFTIFWNGCSGNDGKYMGTEQRFEVPASLVYDVVSSDYGYKRKYTYVRTPKYARIDCSGASTTIKRCLENKISRHALRKAMRDNFKYQNSDVVRLYSDGNDFYFREEGSDGMFGNISGGLVMHHRFGCSGSVDYKEVYFSVHT